MRLLMLERFAQPSPSLREILGSLRGYHFANALVSFLFACTGPVALILTVGIAGGLKPAEIASWVSLAFMLGAVITFAMSYLYRQPLAIAWTIPGTAIVGAGFPRRVSTDNAPYFRFHRWCANLRILGIDHLRSVPGVPASHPFIERLIGTIRREFLDHTLFWDEQDLVRKLAAFTDYYNRHRAHAGVRGRTPAEAAGAPAPMRADLLNHAWKSLSTACSSCRAPHECYFRHAQVVEGPKSAGRVQERNAQTTLLSGVTSIACTGGLAGSSLLDHWLNQLLMTVFPLGRRLEVCRLERA